MRGAGGGVGRGASFSVLFLLHYYYLSYLFILLLQKELFPSEICLVLRDTECLYDRMIGRKRKERKEREEYE